MKISFNGEEEKKNPLNLSKINSDTGILWSAVTGV